MFCVTDSPRVRLEGKRRHVIFADKNERVKISCIGEGNPKPQVYLEKKISANMWAKLHVEPFTTEPSEDSCTIHIYTLGLFSNEDKGTFRCTAKNGVGSEVTSEDIRVEFKSKKRYKTAQTFSLENSIPIRFP